MSSLAIPSDSGLDISYISFNQDASSIAILTKQGYRLFHSDPLKPSHRLSGNMAGLSLIDQLGRTNQIAFSGGGEGSVFSSTNMYLWDGVRRAVSLKAEMKLPVIAVRQQRDHIAVVLLHRVYVYNMQHIKLEHKYETVANPLGILATAQQGDRYVIACPSETVGCVQYEVFGKKLRQNQVQVADTDLQCIALNQQGTLLASASKWGTVVKILNIDTGNEICELRRGIDTAKILSLSFNASSSWLALSSDKGTVHAFRLGEAAAGVGNSRSNFAFLSFALSYFGSSWSAAQFHTNERFLACAFSPHSDTEILIVGGTGSFWKVGIDTVNGGEMEIRESATLMHRSARGDSGDEHDDE